MVVSSSFSKSLKITPKFSEKLARLGISCDQDILLHIPLRYEDETQIIPVDGLRSGVFAQAQVRVIEHSIQFRGRRQLVVTTVDDAGSVLVLRFMNFYGSQLTTFRADVLLRVQGEARYGYYGTEMVHPRYQVVPDDLPVPKTLTSVYPTTEGISQTMWRKLMGLAIKEAPLPEILPPQIIQASWPSLLEAVKLLHAPPPNVNPSALTERDHPAWARIKFEELLAQQLSLSKAKVKRQAEKAPALMANNDLLERLIAQLPFKMTGAQNRAWAQIQMDMLLNTPMHLLVQGDVGSGKTVLAALAVTQCVSAGRQAAVMAPTEILAEQLFEKLSGWFAPLGVQVAWLSSSVTKKNKAQVYDNLANHAIQVLVGTHALIQDAVQFNDLGLAVIDEQHRFGVAQRLALRQKMQNSVTALQHSQFDAPHQLMMSATPIPRTLALSYFADLDVATLDELPPGRTPIVTKLIDMQRRAEVVEKIAHHVAQGEQVYWVCPLIEESETLELQTAIDTHTALMLALPNLAIGLVHGRLSGKEKRNVMAQFVVGEIQILVATTVIEVGVDVPNASWMVIEHAERFGLSQLHQLRGRVGRGALRSTCILLFDKPLSPTAKSRLKTMFESNDGFEIAREDLRLRGPGEFLGARQSGLPLLRFADLEKDLELLELARDAAAWLLKYDEPAADAHLQRWLANRGHFLSA